MSTEIEERVVQMEFDNSKFESNVQTSLKTIDKLKRALKFDGATEGLEEVERASKNVSLSPLSSAVETVKNKFSALEIMGITALMNITNSAVNAGKRMISALTIDPVKTGFQEYETQINAVQTILANTSAKGTTLDQVNEALDELNKYADKTIYNFTEMTRNIGTFTAAGIGLETATNAIQGIANLAAVSGSTSQQASTAMYQLSQALASGTVKLMDWNSVVNAGMGGEVFQNALKETARLMGTDIDAIIEKAGSFRESLSQGWVTADVLTETLKKFTKTGVVEYISNLTGASSESIENLQKMGEACNFSSKEFSEMAKSIANGDEGMAKTIADMLKMATTAEDAATKVKTFTQLFDTLKEAAQSGWTQTWELIIGDFEEAKELLTELSDTFGAAIENMSNARNEVLGGALTSKWDKFIKKLNEAGMSTTDFEERVKSAAKEYGLAVDEIFKDGTTLEQAFKNGAISGKILEKALKGISSKTIDVSKVTRTLNYGAVGEDVKQLQGALAELGFTFDKFGADGILGKETEAAIKAFQEANDLEVTGIVDESTIAAIRGAREEVEDFSSIYDEFKQGLNDIGGRELLVDSLRNAIAGVTKVVGTLKEAWRNVFPKFTSDRLYEIIESIHSFSENLIMTDGVASKVRRTFEGLFSILSLGKKVISVVFKGIKNILSSGLVKNVANLFLEVIASLSSIFTVINRSIESFGSSVKDAISKSTFLQSVITKINNGFIAASNWIGNVSENVSGYLETVIDKARTWFGTLMQSEKAQVAMEALAEAFRPVKDFFVRLKTDPVAVFNSIKNSLTNFWKQIKDLFKNLKKNGISAFAQFYDYLKTRFKNFTTFLTPIGTFFTNIYAAIKESLEKAGIKVDEFEEKVVKIWNKIKGVFERSGIGGILSIGIVVLLIAAAKKIKDVISDIMDNIHGVKTALIGVLDGISYVLRSVGKYIRAKAFHEIAKGVLDIAIAIAILAGSVYLITQIPENKLEVLKTAAIIIGALAAVLVGLSIALDIMSSKGIIKGDAGTGLTKLAVALALMAASLWLVSTIPTDKLFDAAMTLGVIAAALFILGKNISKLSPGSLPDTAIFVKMSLAIFLLSVALKQVAGIPIENLFQATLALSGLIFVMAALVYITGQTSITGTAGLGVLAMAAAVILMIAAIKQVSKMFDGMNIVDILKNVLKLVLVMGAMYLLMIATNSASKSAWSAGIGALAIVVALMLMIKVIEKLQGLPMHNMGKVILVIAVMALIFAGLMAATRLAGSDAIKAGASLLLMSVALGILAVVIGLLSTIAKTNPKGLWAAVGAIAVLAVVFALCTGLAASANKAVGNIIAMTVAIVAIAIVIGVMSTIPTETLLPIALSLLMVMGGMSLMFVAAGLAGKAGGAAIGAIALMIVALGAIAGVLYLLQRFGDVDKMMTIAESMALLFGAMALVMLACLAVGAVPGGLGAVTMGLGALIEVLVVCGLVAAGVLALSDKIPEDYEAKMDKAIKLMYKVGELVGSIIGGALAGISSGFPTIGENLSAFAENIQPFLDVFNNLGEGMTSKISDFMTGIKKLSNASIWQGVLDWLNGKNNESPLVQLGDDLGVFGAKINSFTSIDPEKLGGTIDALKRLSEIGEAVPDTGRGLFGKGDLSKWTEDLAYFAENIGGFLTLDTTNVSTVVADLQTLQTGLKGFSADADTFSVDFTSVITSIEGYNDAFYDKGTALGSKLIDGLKSEAETARSAVRSALSGAVSGVRGMYSSFYSAGGYTGQGIADGLSAKYYQVWSAAYYLGEAALKGYREYLDQHSPSRVMIKQGEFTGDGAVIGVLNRISAMKAAGADLGKASVDGMNEAITRAAIAIENSPDYQPKIVPVLDLSEVQNGASKLGSMLGNRSFSISGSISRAESTSKILSNDNAIDETGTSGNTYNTFNQYNTSPKSLSRIEIYRQTKNLLSASAR